VFLDQFENEIEVKSTLFVNRERERPSAGTHRSRNSHQTAVKPSVRKNSLFEREDGSIGTPEVADEGSVNEPGA